MASRVYEKQDPPSRQDCSLRSQRDPPSAGRIALPSRAERRSLCERSEQSLRERSERSFREAQPSDPRLRPNWKRDRRINANDQPFDLFYRDNAGLVNQVELYNTPVAPINDVVYNSAWINDTWKLTNRFTVNLGVRFERYRDGWNEQQFAPNGHPALVGFNDPIYQDFIAPRTVNARTVALTNTFSPRVGFAYDLTGDNRTVLKVYAGQSRWNSADQLADEENPVGQAELVYEFVPCSGARTSNCDLNGDRLVNGPSELGRLITTNGGGGFVRIDRDLIRPTSNEVSVNLERELRQALSGRVSYVYKSMRNVWAEVDAVRTPAFTIPVTITDPGPDNRRFSGRWMLLSSVGYTWSTMLHNTTGYTRDFSYRPARRMFGDEFGRETSTIWNYKIIGRYTMPWEIGFSGSWKVQSGQQYGRTMSFTFPGDGQQTFRVEPVTANRYPTVAILDLRADKAFQFGKFGKLTAMVDVFNLTNSSAVTTLRVTSANYREVTAILDPRIVRFGLRLDF